MEAALLIGNGLNRCYKDAIAWNKLLNEIAQGYDVEFCDKNPFPLEFESIVNQILSKEKQPSDKIYLDVKELIANSVSEQKPEQNSIHQHFTRDLPIRHIFTTNYDYMLEYAYSGSIIKDEVKSESHQVKYSQFRQKPIGEKIFYHIHGEASYAATLCLGYEHYAGYLSKMREHLKASPEIKLRIEKKKLPEKISWVDFFFTHDIYIVGLTLDPCEIDLWWLLTYRAYLYYSNDSGLRSIIKNKVKFYYPDKKRNADQEKLFKHLHVECCPVRLNGNDYVETYEKILADIKQSVHSRMEE